MTTDLGTWTAYETPGHAPSHVCLYQPERRVLISGDHLLGRISLFYEYGFSPDPVGEFLRSLDRVRTLDAKYDGVWELPVLGAVPPPSALLVRPDGHVAWVGGGMAHGLRGALTTWFGPADRG